MDKYYTKPCNFYFGKNSISKIKKKKSLPLHGNKLVSFDTIEIISRKSSKTLGILEVKLLPEKVKYKVQQDLKKITKKKKFKIILFTCINGGYKLNSRQFFRWW